MHIEGYVASVLTGEPPPAIDLHGPELPALVDRLKAEADRHWRIDPRLSICCADAIVAIGQTTGDLRVVALGTMARGDALKLLNRLDDAWETLAQAGALYRQAGDEVGWARTRIGRVGICVQLQQVPTAMREADEARQILTERGVRDRLTILEVNIGAAWNFLGEYQKALLHYQSALEQALGLGDDGRRFLGMIYTNLGYTEQGLGHLQRAESLYQAAYDVMQADGERSGMAIALLNIASVAKSQGRFRHALKLLNESYDTVRDYLPLSLQKARFDMIDCYLYLNRFEEARALAMQALADAGSDESDYDSALLLLGLAQAEATLNNRPAAERLLERASGIFTALSSEHWLAELNLRWGQMAVGWGDTTLARQKADETERHFAAAGEAAQQASASLLRARLLAAEGDVAGAAQAAHRALVRATLHDLPAVRYDALILLGQLAEPRRPARAIHHYQQAAAVMERVQRSLTLTLRTRYLRDKQDALRHLLRLYLTSGRAAEAFDALERTKAQVWLTYLGQKDELRWLREDETNQALLGELRRLREEHYWFFQVAHDPLFREQHHALTSPSEALQEAAGREARMHQIIEQLYLRTGSAESTAAPRPALADIQASLSRDQRLVAYYTDGAQMWAFVLTPDDLHVTRLPESADRVQSMIDRLQDNINRALRAGPSAPEVSVLADYARRLLQKLYAALIEPLAEWTDGAGRLVIVPFGAQHYLPFHALHDGDRYLTQAAELVVLPTASLITRGTVERERGVLALAHSWDGRLQQTTAEAYSVSARLGGRVYTETEARQHVLERPPCQVLHIAAHGQYRLDNPDFSYIHLADGPVYADDLYQHDLSYPLVTLSACETGRGHAAPGDELIGLGRSILFAGARALIASLWRVDDAMTLVFMQTLYEQLAAGASKAAALREAQSSLLAGNPALHPAFWGAFELIGCADPLISPHLSSATLHREFQRR